MLRNLTRGIYVKRSIYGSIFNSVYFIGLSDDHLDIKEKNLKLSQERINRQEIENCGKKYTQANDD